MAPELHPALAPVAFLLGEWEGPGEGDYPTIEPFAYTEHLTFGHVGKPFLTYLQRTWAPDGSPMHTESGYVRVTGPGTTGHAVELVLSMPTGVVEVLVGTVVDGDISLTSTLVGMSPTAKRVDATERRFRLEGELLVVDMGMDAVGRGFHHHLRSELHRTP
jgi:THAP4-like, heme-binding beta-barrel domain